MSIFKKSKRKQTEEVLLDRVANTNPTDPGYDSTVKALETVNATKSDKKGFWTFAGMIGAALVTGLLGIGATKINTKEKRETLKYFHNVEEKKNTVWSTSAENAAERDMYFG